MLRETFTIVYFFETINIFVMFFVLAILTIGLSTMVIFVILKDPIRVIYSIIRYPIDRLELESYKHIKETGLRFSELENLISSLEKIEIKIKKSNSIIKFHDYNDNDINNLKALFISFKPDGTITGLNEMIVKESIREGKDIIGTNIFNRLSVTENEIVKNQLYFNINEAIGTKKKVSFINDSISTKIDNEPQREIYQLTLTPYFDEIGEIEEFLVCSIDITNMHLEKERLMEEHSIEKAKIENVYDEVTEALNGAMKEWVNSQKLSSLGSLVSGVSHEINTPLGVSVSAASFLKEINDMNIKKIEANLLSKSDFLEYIDTVSKTLSVLEYNLERSAELIKNFKNLAVNQSLEEKIRFNLPELVNSVILSVRHEYKNMDLEFSLEWPPELYLFNYPGLFSQVFTSIFINSLRHGLKGKKNALIEITLKIKNDRLIIEISDNGIGISAENIYKIFDPFYTTNRGSQSTGLGLSVVYNIVTKQLDGRINCESVPNVKTTMRLDIPIS